MPEIRRENMSMWKNMLGEKVFVTLFCMVISTDHTLPCTDDVPVCGDTCGKVSL